MARHAEALSLPVFDKPPALKATQHECMARTVDVAVAASMCESSGAWAKGRCVYSWLLDRAGTYICTPGRQCMSMVPQGKADGGHRRVAE